MVTAKIPENVVYWMNNYNEGYKFGARDGMMLRPYAENFSRDPHGFMTGYFHGYLAAYEKKRGYTIALALQDEIGGKLKPKKVDDKILPPEIIREDDRSGD